MKHQAREQIEDRRPNLVSALKQVGDFYMQIKWDFQSWGKTLLIFTQLIFLLSILIKDKYINDNYNIINTSNVYSAIGFSCATFRSMSNS